MKKKHPQWKTSHRLSKLFVSIY